MDQESVNFSCPTFPGTSAPPLPAAMLGFNTQADGPPGSGIPPGFPPDLPAYPGQVPVGGATYPEEGHPIGHNFLSRSKETQLRYRIGALSTRIARLLARNEKQAEEIAALRQLLQAREGHGEPGVFTGMSASGPHPQIQCGFTGSGFDPHNNQGGMASMRQPYENQHQCAQNLHYPVQGVGGPPIDPRIVEDCETLFRQGQSMFYHEQQRLKHSIEHNHEGAGVGAGPSLGSAEPRIKVEEGFDLLGRPAGESRFDSTRIKEGPGVAASTIVPGNQIIPRKTTTGPSAGGISHSEYSEDELFPDVPDGHFVVIIWKVEPYVAQPHPEEWVLAMSNQFD
ncbi:hypothetical protein GGR53DRAFT_527818 [Hypoxylon sp. FL1150]|nr:hypothetical protein GGR53DRAFT_527818 [Hypoxylon sp. FL1150]